MTRLKEKNTDSNIIINENANENKNENENLDKDKDNNNNINNNNNKISLNSNEDKDNIDNNLKLNPLIHIKNKINTNTLNINTVNLYKNSLQNPIQNKFIAKPKIKPRVPILGSLISPNNNTINTINTNNTNKYNNNKNINIFIDNSESALETINNLNNIKRGCLINNNKIFSQKNFSKTFSKKFSINSNTNSNTNSIDTEINNLKIAKINNKNNKINIFKNNSDIFLLKKQYNETFSKIKNIKDIVARENISNSKNLNKIYDLKSPNNKKKMNINNINYQTHKGNIDTNKDKAKDINGNTYYTNLNADKDKNKVKELNFKSKKDSYLETEKNEKAEYEINANIRPIIKKEKENVKGIPGRDTKEMVYIDEKKANIINHVDKVVKMNNENFYKFKNILCKKYENFSNNLDNYETIFRNSRYTVTDNFKIINKNTEKLKWKFEKMKQTNNRIVGFFDEYKNRNNKK